MKIDLLGTWAEVIESTRALKQKDPPQIPLPTDIAVAAPQIHYVSTEEGARRMLRELKGVPIRVIGLDTEYQYSSPPLILKNKEKWNDVRSQVPLVLSVAAWVEKRQRPEDQAIIQYVIDLRVASLTPYVDELLRLRVPFIFHNVKAELMTFWSLGLDPNLKNIYDTYIAAACINLGFFHRRIKLENEQMRRGSFEGDQKEKSTEEKRAGLLSLVGQCAHYEIRFPFSHDKDELRNLFMELRPGEPLSDRMLAYAAADAEATVRVYVAQQRDILRHSLQQQLYEVEFPFAVANARMEWNGVLLSSEKMNLICEGCDSAIEHFGGRLKALGMKNPGSRLQFIALMRSLGLAHYFTKKTPSGEPSTEDDYLEMIENAHPSIGYFRKYLKYRGLSGGEWLQGHFTGADGRVHPNHRQLGAQTGRNSCQNPNLAGLGKIFRPVVIAPPGKAILEADYAQVEVGIVGAEYNDLDLIAAYNSGDVYAYMAQRFYYAQLSPEERTMLVKEFKKRHPDLRNNMKVFVLAVLYNAQAELIATTFHISLKEAEKQRERFLDLYPTVKRALEESSIYGRYRGYAYTNLGLRRHIHPRSKLNQWTNNFLRNTPIQGSAATVFKKAVINLDEAFLGTENKVILTAHDAVIVECAESEMEMTAQTLKFIMRTTLRSFYPVLKGTVEVNKEHPHCWNKDGHFDSIEKFLADPQYKL